MSDILVKYDLCLSSKAPEVLKTSPNQVLIPGALPGIVTIPVKLVKNIHAIKKGNGDISEMIGNVVTSSCEAPSYVTSIANLALNILSLTSPALQIAQKITFTLGSLDYIFGSFFLLSTFISEVIYLSKSYYFKKDSIFKALSRKEVEEKKKLLKIWLGNENNLIPSKKEISDEVEIPEGIRNNFLNFLNKNSADTNLIIALEFYKNHLCSKEKYAKFQAVIGVEASKRAHRDIIFILNNYLLKKTTKNSSEIIQKTQNSMKIQIEKVVFIRIFAFISRLFMFMGIALKMHSLALSKNSAKIAKYIGMAILYIGIVLEVVKFWLGEAILDTEGGKLSIHDGLRPITEPLKACIPKRKPKKDHL